MFGIKTKKDKRIEELEQLNLELSKQMRMEWSKIPKVLENHANVAKVTGTVVLDDGMPVEITKEIIAQKIAEGLKNEIHYVIEDVDTDLPRRRMLRGYINVVVKGE